VVVKTIDEIYEKSGQTVNACYLQRISS
jgi:hypothetical protein